MIVFAGMVRELWAGLKLFRVSSVAVDSALLVVVFLACRHVAHRFQAFLTRARRLDCLNVVIGGLARPKVVGVGPLAVDGAIAVGVFFPFLVTNRLPKVYASTRCHIGLAWTILEICGFGPVARFGALAVRILFARFLVAYGGPKGNASAWWFVLRFIHVE